ncbi:MAG TPA: glycosyltransferase family 39 protein [Patescibacteria group bacterium]|nr:glycosyltransferase family 39 protein [Patescibacteria group bacterium]
MRKTLNKLLKIGDSRIIEVACLLLILIGAFGVRLYKIDNPLDDWHSWRQADTVSVSQVYVDQGINLLKPRYYDISSTQTGYFNPQGLRFVEFPIYNLINVVLFETLHHFSLEVWARLISVVSAVGSSFFIYLIGKRFLGKLGGLASAFFYAFIPYNIYFTRVILPEPMAVFVTLASLWFFMIFLDHKKNYLFFLLLSAIFLAIGMLLKPFVAFYFPVYLYLLIKKHGLKVFWTNVWIYIYLALALVPFFLWRAWMDSGTNFIGIPFFVWLLNGNGIRFRPAWFRWIFGTRLGDLILGVWGLPLFAFGVLKRKNLPIILMATGMLLYVAVVADGNVQHDYYQTQTIPAICLMLASGIVFLFEQKFNKLVVAGFVGFCTLMMLGMGWFGISGDYQINHYEIIVAGMEANKILPKNAKVIAPYNGDTTFLYQTKRFGWPVVDDDIKNMIKDGADYYISVNYDNDTNNLLKQYKAIEQNPTFVIIDLHQLIQRNK